MASWPLKLVSVCKTDTWTYTFPIWTLQLEKMGTNKHIQQSVYINCADMYNTSYAKLFITWHVLFVGPIFKYKISKKKLQIQKRKKGKTPKTYYTSFNLYTTIPLLLRHLLPSSSSFFSFLFSSLFFPLLFLNQIHNITMAMIRP